MTRAVFLSAGGDPFIASLAIKLWRERWRDEVTAFYVSYNNHSQVPVEVVQEFLQRISADPKIHIIYHPNGIGNGMPITEMSLIAKEDLVMLLEDDGFIFSQGVVDDCFKKIESGECDALGSPRSSCGPEVTEAMVKKYNIDISGFGDKGVNYWPNFFFCKKKDLLATDLNFASKKFGKEEYYPELNCVFTEDNYGDTFVWADIQMRYNGVRFADIPQHHAHPYDIEYAMQYTNLFDGKTRWVHGGSLSAGWGGYLSGRIPDVSTDMAKQEIESRVAFWTIAVKYTEGFDKFRISYASGIEDLIIGANLDRHRIDKKIEIYRNLMKL